MHTSSFQSQCLVFYPCVCFLVLSSWVFGRRVWGIILIYLVERNKLRTEMISAAGLMGPRRHMFAWHPTMMPWMLQTRLESYRLYSYYSFCSLGVVARQFWVGTFVFAQKFRCSQTFLNFFSIISIFSYAVLKFVYCSTDRFISLGFCPWIMQLARPRPCLSVCRIEPESLLCNPHAALPALITEPDSKL